MPLWNHRWRWRARAPITVSHARELWRATVPGAVANSVLSDPVSGSVFVSDGWGVSFAALRLHRLDLGTGEHRAARRTRHQPVGAMCLWRDTLLVATASRLFRLGREDLSVVQEWNGGLVRYTQHVVPAGDLVIMANWRRRSVGVFDPETGRTRRVTVGEQPLVFTHGDEVRAIAGFDGGMWILDPNSGKLRCHEHTPPIFTAAAGREIWAVLAGPPHGGKGVPPVWTRGGTDVLVSLTGHRDSIRLGGPCDRIVVDDERDVVWCSVNGGTRLEAVSQSSGQVVTRFQPAVAERGHVFCHVDPSAGLAFGLIPERTRNLNKGTPSPSMLVCYALLDDTMDWLPM